MIKRMAVVALIAFVVSWLAGCSSLNPPAAYYEAQARVEVARIQAESLPKMEVECKDCVIAYRGDIAHGRGVAEGQTAGKIAAQGLAVVESALYPAAMAAVAIKGIGSAGDKIINGDGNDVSEKREYNVATEQSTQRVRADDDNKQYADAYNNQPTDNRENYSNEQWTDDNSAVSEPTVVTTEKVVPVEPSVHIVKPEVITGSDN